MARDPFADHAGNRLMGPASDMVPVTQDAELDPVAVALYIEAAGDVEIVTQAGNTRTVAVADNAILPVGVKQVNSAGTTATGIFAFVI